MLGSGDSNSGCWATCDPDTTSEWSCLWSFESFKWQTDRMKQPGNNQPTMHLHMCLEELFNLSGGTENIQLLRSYIQMFWSKSSSNLILISHRKFFSDLHLKQTTDAQRPLWLTARLVNVLSQHVVWHKPGPSWTDINLKDLGCPSFILLHVR